VGVNRKTFVIGNLMRSIGFIIEFIMKLSSLVTLISFIIFRDLLGLENPFNGLVNEIREGRRVLTKKP